MRSKDLGNFCHLSLAWNKDKAALAHLGRHCAHDIWVELQREDVLGAPRASDKAAPLAATADEDTAAQDQRHARGESKIG